VQLCRFAGYGVDGRTVRKQVHRVESPMEYYWESRSKNAQNNEARVCPLCMKMSNLNSSNNLLRMEVTGFTQLITIYRQC